MDAIGAIGICRTIIYGRANDLALFDENIFPKDNITLEEYKNQTKENHSINHFFDKLLKIKHAMQTDAAKKEAKSRHDFLVRFLSQFFMEQNLDDWQKYLEDYLKEV